MRAAGVLFNNGAGSGTGGYLEQQIQYCTTPDGVRLAFAVTGEGTPFVRVSQWMSHLDHEIQSPVRRTFIIALTQRHKLVRYDARGNGLSQREVAEISFERWVSDLETIVDATGIERFALFGASQGAGIAIQYAVRHPERVTHLIINGGFARGNLFREDPEKEAKLLELSRTLVREGWGSSQETYRQWFTSQFIPGATAEEFHWFNELQRVSATPDIAERYLVEAAKINVAELLPKVKTPTLVIHSKGDVRVPFALGQEIAAHIPNAKLVPLDSINHMLLPSDPAGRVFFQALTSFLGDPPLKGALPGTQTFRERLDASIKNVEQNWLVKVIIILAAITGCFIFALEAWRLWRH